MRARACAQESRKYSDARISDIESVLSMQDRVPAEPRAAAPAPPSVREACFVARPSSALHGEGKLPQARVVSQRTPHGSLVTIRTASSISPPAGAASAWLHREDDELNPPNGDLSGLI